MKKILTILTIAIFTIATSFAIDLSDLETGFESMGEDLGSAIASSATTGLVWSDAYVGNFPHFGAGLFVGAQVMPIGAFTDLLSVVDTGASLPSELTNVGIPVPAFGIDGRIGGFILPFDIGVKFAMLNELEFSGVSFDYSLIGADVRYALIKGGLIFPKISVGVGFSRLTTEIGVSGILDGDYEILPANSTLGTSAVVLTNPDLVYGWESNVIEFKAQASKNLIFVTPSVGFNAAYSMTTIGGGLSTSVTDGTTTLSQADIDDAIAAAGVDYEIDANGFESYSETTAWSFKINAGASFNILVLKIDLSANYDIFSESYGGQLGFRVQL